MSKELSHTGFNIGVELIVAERLATLKMLKKPKADTIEKVFSLGALVRAIESNVAPEAMVEMSVKAQDRLILQRDING